MPWVMLAIKTQLAQIAMLDTLEADAAFQANLHPILPRPFVNV